MGYRLLADLTLILHLLFIMFVLFGGYLVLHRKRWAWLHLPAALWGVWVEWGNRACPLTPLENYFRQLSSGHAFRESFVEHYLLPLLYPGHLTVSTQWLLGGIVLAMNLFVYSYVIRNAHKYRNRLDD